MLDQPLVLEKVGEKLSVFIKKGAYFYAKPFSWLDREFGSCFPNFKYVLSFQKELVNEDIIESCNFKLFKYLSLSASTNYQEVWTFETIEREYNEDLEEVITTTNKGFDAFRTYNFLSLFLSQSPLTEYAANLAHHMTTKTN